MFLVKLICQCCLSQSEAALATSAIELNNIDMDATACLVSLATPSCALATICLCTHGLGVTSTALSDPLALLNLSTVDFPKKKK